MRDKITKMRDKILQLIETIGYSYSGHNWHANKIFYVKQSIDDINHYICIKEAQSKLLISHFNRDCRFEMINVHHFTIQSDEDLNNWWESIK